MAWRTMLLSNMKSDSTQPATAHRGRRHATTAAELTQQNVEAMRKLEQSSLAKRGVADHTAAFVARFGGSMAFVWIHVLIFSSWIAFNTWPGLPHFDPYPFTFLTLVVSLEAIFLSSFILISQNYEMRITERRSQLDLQINLLSEQENTKMLQMLARIARKVGADCDDDPEIQALEEATRPDMLVRQIEKTYRKDAGTA